MNRRGKSLVELLVVVSMLGAILGSVGTVVYRLMRAERAVETDLVWNRSVTALAEQFRADVHAATAAEIVTDGDGLSLTLPAGKVTYAITARGVRRTLESPGEPAQQEEFRCGDAAARFRTQNHEGRTWATVIIPRNTASLTRSVSAPTTIELEIRAVLGRLTGPAMPEGVS